MKKFLNILACFVLSLTLVSCGDDELFDPEAILLQFPDDMIVTPENRPVSEEAAVITKKGIKSITVRIVSTSEELTASLTQLGKNSKNLDFTKGVELVDNQELKGFFASMQQRVDLPERGEKDYDFPLGKFIPMLSLIRGEHGFFVNVVDMRGSKKNDVFKLTVNF